jgi:hypothetical protein
MDQGRSNDVRWNTFLISFSALWRGIGPALVLVVNPIIQYTVFEQLKNFLVKRRTARFQIATGSSHAIVLSDWDFFFLGAVSKLGDYIPVHNSH